MSSSDAGSFDVIVVGAGIMGSAAAWRLAMRGRSVLLLEQFGRDHTNGSSHGGSRIFRYAYPDAEYVALARRARPLWSELESEAGAAMIDVTGGVDHGDRARSARSATRSRRWVCRSSAGRPLMRPNGSPDCGLTARSASSPMPAAATPRSRSRVSHSAR